MRVRHVLLLLVLPLAVAACNSGGSGGSADSMPDLDPGTDQQTMTIHSVAKQCVTIKADDGRYIRRTDGGYAADATDTADAAGFFLQPTDLGSYLLLSGYDRAVSPLTDNATGSGDPGEKQLLGIADPVGRLLDSAGALVDHAGENVSGVGDMLDLILDPVAPLGQTVNTLGDNVGGIGDTLRSVDGAPALAMASQAGDLAVWKLSEPRDDRFQFTSPETGLRLVADNGRLALTDTADMRDATLFTFEPVEDCATYPEAGRNARVVDPRGPRIFWNEKEGTVYGWVDDHAHITAYEFIGGRVNYGRNFHEFGIDHAMGDCAVNHGPEGTLGILEMVTSSDAFGPHETTGWPTYNEWPRAGSLQHHQTYYRWIERSFLSGQKILVNLITHNEVLCQVYPLKENDCDVMENVRLQAKRTYQLQDYIDAQHGGPGEGWFRVVESPAEARAVIADGKMAVVLGIELSKVLNCGEFLDQPECTREQIDDRLDEVEDLGVRVIFPVHKFDNAFGGHLPHSGFGLGTFLTAGNLLETGHTIEVEECPVDENGDDDFSDPANDPRNNPAGIFDWLLAGLEYNGAQINPTGPSTDHLCNIRGLTNMGYYLLDELVKRGMLVDVDHMSRRAADAAISYLASRGYPMISSHDWLGSETLLNDLTDANGFLGRFARGGRDQWIDRLTGIAERYDNEPFMGGGIASDVNGIAHLPKDPREGAEISEGKIDYPVLSYDGRVEFDKQVTGDRVFSLYDGRGVAHYGLYPDYIADAQRFGGPDAEKGLDIFFRSAEAWLRMWERAERVAGTNR